MQFPDSVMIREVAPRDGLQSLGKPIATDQKIQMIDLLSETGFAAIEVTGFAHPRVIPQLADAEEVVAGITRRSGVDYRALVPNIRGAERALTAGVDTLVALMTASESYSQRNQNRSVDELIDEALKILRLGRDAGVAVDVAVGIAFFCPYEGVVPEEQVESIFARLIDGGATSLYVATTVGMANPRQVYSLCSRLLRRWPDVDLAIHLHNTNGMALANGLAAMQAGVRTFEGAVCGIGGGIAMPEELGGVGNVATEDLVHLFEECGVDTGLDVDEVTAAARSIGDLLDVRPASYITRGGSRAQVLAHRTGGDAPPRPASSVD